MPRSQRHDRAARYSSRKAIVRAAAKSDVSWRVISRSESALKPSGCSGWAAAGWFNERPKLRSQRTTR